VVRIYDIDVMTPMSQQGGEGLHVDDL
jgi:hypothetical protein